MTERIWFCDVPRSTSALIGFAAAASDDPDRLEVSKRLKPIFTANWRGEKVSEGDVPDKLYYRQPGRFRKPVPPVFVNGFTYLRADVAEILRAHDMGQAALFAVNLFQNDKVTPVEGDVFTLNVANSKPTIDPESFGLRRFVPGQDWYVLPRDLPARHGNFTAPRSTLEGPDLWVDPRIVQTMFFSDRLVQSLKAAKLHRQFDLYPCKTE
ncbi:hypothetical protein KUL25_16780 [Rhodobacteraceae bacterium N5(2021)]|uniref:Uncharacterized protein n=1 Tax=Gymnodinialimonas phycosphaerae TaxID=2841589 RepID=A0A975TSZ8_9RHOB|nr:hypothetical protein [Gymnodinialimonas phycosphaerae]MBY4894413.1 hypothetical protein [Gymnodinialimonas phycosphaerae]